MSTRIYTNLNKRETERMEKAMEFLVDEGVFSENPTIYSFVRLGILDFIEWLEGQYNGKNDSESKSEGEENTEELG